MYYVLMFNELMSGENGINKKIRNFLFFVDKHLSTFLEIDQLFYFCSSNNYLSLKRM